MNTMKYLLLGLMILLNFACSDSNRKLLKDNVYLEKVSEKEYNLIFDPDKKEERVFRCVDSLGVSPEHYGFLVYGISDFNTEKKWYYIAGAGEEFKKIFGGWYDGEFRKYRLKEISHNEEIYSYLKSSEQIWNEK